MKHKHNMKWVGCGLVLVLVALCVNLVLTVRLSSEVQSAITDIQAQKSVPCAAIPTRLILEDPECADKLLRVMNVARVRVVPKGQPETNE